LNVVLLLRQKPSQGFFAHLRQQMDCLDLATAAAAATIAEILCALSLLQTTFTFPHSAEQPPWPSPSPLVFVE